jgi:hypothetical protein
MKMRCAVMICCILLATEARIMAQPRYSIVIHEILPDPDPVRSLPNSEFIELRNAGTEAVNLRGWSLSNGSTTGRIARDHWLRPDSLVILSSSGALASYSVFGTTAPLTPFPTLNNEGDTLVLRSPTGAVIHALTWDRSSFGNALKSQGGWTLEMRDHRKPCLRETNWAASVSLSGGSPGKPNSIAGVLKDSTAPFATMAFMKDSITAVVIFSEPVSNPSGEHFMVKGLKAKTVRLLPPLFNMAELMLSEPLQPERTEVIAISGVQDCSGNLSMQAEMRIGIFRTPDAGDLVINEILFDPPPDGADYLEIYNRSTKTVDLGSVYLSNRDINGGIAPPKRSSDFVWPLLPGAFTVLTGNGHWLLGYYRANPTRVISAVLPTLPDDKGNIILLDQTGNILDELRYDAKWHHPLVSDPRGVALERIRADLPTQTRQNWQSASSSERYGTPGKVNSQAAREPPDTGRIALSSPLISPDLDGRDDQLVIHYTMDQPGYIANIAVYDLYGALRKNIARNELCGTKGQFIWDGTDDRNQFLRSGNYVLIAEFFSVAGRKHQIKRVIGIWQPH